MALILLYHSTFALRIPEDRALKLVLVAPLYITNAQFASLLSITSTSNAPVTLFARFDSLEGEGVGTKTVTLGPRSGAKIDLDSVDMAPHRFRGLGSISVFVSPFEVDAITGRLTILSRTDAEIHVEEKLDTIGRRVCQLCVASVPAPSSVPILAIHNLTEEPQHISVKCTDSAGSSYESQLSLPPRMTFLLNACITGRSESRTYEQVLRGDIGTTKGALTIQVKGTAPLGCVSVWGFAGASLPGSRPQIIGIDFVGQSSTV